MDSRQLVRDAIAHRSGPRVPCRIDLTAEAWERLRPLAGGREADDLLGNDVATVAPPWWNWTRLGPEWQAADPPAQRETVAGCGSYPEFEDAVRRARGSGRYVLVTIWGSHWEKAYFARGIDNFLADLAGAREWAQAFLARIVDRNLAMLDNILALDGIDGVLLGSDWGTQRGMIMSPRTWREAIAPGERRSYDLIRAAGKDVWVHSCGNIAPIIGDLVGLGVDVLNPVQPECMDLAQLKRDFGPRLAFWGGVSTQRTLPFGTPAEVRHEARNVRALMAAGGGYIFAPAQALQGDVPPENILALAEVAREG